MHKLKLRWSDGMFGGSEGKERTFYLEVNGLNIFEKENDLLGITVVRGNPKRRNHDVR